MAGQKLSRMHKHVVEMYQNSTLKEFLRTQSKPKAYLEFYTTMYYLKRYLPPRGTILEAGSGPGRYTLELAKMGYNVVAIDPAANSIEFLRRRVSRAGLSNRVQARLGRIEDLSDFKGGSFDAVLCLGGPLSHVMGAQQRKRAVSELLRVAKRGAPVAISVMCRTAMLKGYLKIFPNEITAPYVRPFMKTGDYTSPHLYGFTHFHGFTAGEFRALFTGMPFKELELAGLEGVGSYENVDLRKLHRNKRRWNAWLGYHLMLSNEPSMVGASEHLLIVGRKK